MQSLRKEHRDQFNDNVVPTSTSEIYDFLQSIAQINAILHPPPDPGRYWNNIPNWAEKSTTEVTESFYIALQNRVEDTWYPQGRLHLFVEQGDFYKNPIPEIPPDSEVTLSASLYNIFKVGIPEKPYPAASGGPEMF